MSERPPIQITVLAPTGAGSSTIVQEIITSLMRNGIGVRLDESVTMDGDPIRSNHPERMRAMAERKTVVEVKIERMNRLAVSNA